MLHKQRWSGRLLRDFAVGKISEHPLGRIQAEGDDLTVAGTFLSQPGFDLMAG